MLKITSGPCRHRQSLRHRRFARRNIGQETSRNTFTSGMYSARPGPERKRHEIRQRTRCVANAATVQSKIRNQGGRNLTLRKPKTAIANKSKNSSERGPSSSKKAVIISIGTLARITPVLRSATGKRRGSHDIRTGSRQIPDRGIRPKSPASRT